MSAASERMSRVDTAWLRMDNDVNLMLIVGVWLLDESLGAVRATGAVLVLVGVTVLARLAARRG